MKNISKLLLLMTFNLYACVLPIKPDLMDGLIEKMDRPKRIVYQEFMEKIGKLKPIKTSTNKENKLMEEYDINSDGKADIIIGYTYLTNIDSKGRLKLKKNKHPCIYGIDVNGDGKIKDYEELVDTFEDGLNDNEMTRKELNLEIEMLEVEKDKKPDYSRDYLEKEWGI